MKCIEDYKELLELGGAEVLAYEKFGSYQGDWLAKVKYQGKTFWIHDYFGSCIGCDNLLATQDNFWGEELSEEAIQNLKELASEYLEEPADYQKLLERFGEQSGWDLEGGDVLQFLKKHGEA